MPVPYAERKKRRKKLAAELPPDLQGQIALRHVEAVSAFSPQAQRTLAEALAAGASASAAVAFLKDHPEAGRAEVVASCRARQRKKQMTDGKLPRVEAPTESAPDGSESGTQQVSEQTLTELTDLLRYCYPDMPAITAEAMAAAELLAGVRAVIGAQQACLAAPEAESDFVLVALCGLAVQTLARLDQRVSARPAYRRALAQSGVDWPEPQTAGPASAGRAARQ